MLRELITILLLGACALASERDFMLPLKLTHSHLAEIFLGCKEGATDAYDRGVDDLAPPRGQGTGCAGFIGPPTLGSLLYKDLKAHGNLKEWEITLEVHEGKPMKISWQSEKLPECYDLTFVTNDYEKDMRKVNELEFTTSQTVVIVAGLNPEAWNAAKARAQGDQPDKPEVVTTPKPAPEKRPSTAAVPGSPPPASKRVTGSISMLVLAMGGLFLLIVIFAAVRR